MNLPWTDTDQLIEKHSNLSIPEIFSTQGESCFRALESTQLQNALGSYPIVATGGGIVISQKNRELLQEKATVIYLKASLETLEKRTAGTGRPLLKNTNALAELLESREKFYEKCADFVVLVDELNPHEIAEAIIRWLD